MSGLSGIPTPPKAFDYSSGYNLWSPELNHIHKDALVPSYSSSESDKRSPKRSKKSKKHRTKHHKRHQEQHNLEGYILQVIGILCFVLAAIKAFEPLTGVGFTLVLIGYNKNAKRKVDIDTVTETKRDRTKNVDTVKQKDRRRRERTDEMDDFVIVDRISKDGTDSYLSRM